MTPELTVDSPGEAPKQIPSTAGMTTKVVKGSMWTLAGQVAPLAVSLVTTPFVIRMLGAEGYGVFILVGLIPAYLSFADFGMSIASTKFGSEAYGEGDVGKEGRVVRTTALIALMSSVPVGALLIIFAGNVVGLFSVPPAYVAEATLAVRISAVTFVINILCSIFNTPVLARLRMDLNTFVTSGFRILGLIATPIVIYLGGGILGAVTVLLVASLLILAGELVLSRRFVPYIFRWSIDRAAIPTLLRFGGALVAASIAAALLVNIEKGILARTVSTTALAYYSVAFTLAGMLTMFSTAMVRSLLPAFSQLQSSDSRDRLSSLYSRVIRMNLIWAIPALVGLIVFAKPFLTLWAGEDFGRESLVPFYIVTFGLAFNIFAYFPHAAIMASGRTDVFARLYWIELVVYVVLVWVMTSRFGIVGAAAAWSLRVIADALVLFALARRIGGVTFSIEANRGFAYGLGVMLLPIAALAYFKEATLVVVALALVSFGAYAAVIYKRALRKEEITWIASVLRARFATK